MLIYGKSRNVYETLLATLNNPEHLLCNQMEDSSNTVTHRYYVAILNALEGVYNEEEATQTKCLICSIKWL